MEDAKESSSQYNNEVQRFAEEEEEEEEEDDDDDDDDDDNEEINIASRQALSLTSAEVEDCNDTHFGNKKIFEESVEVSHIFEIPAGQPIPTSTSLPFTNNGEFPVLQDVQTAMSTPHLPPFSSPDFRRSSGWSRDDVIAVDRTAGAVCVAAGGSSEHPVSEHQPLLENSKRENFTIHLKYCALIFTILHLLIGAVVLTVIYGHTKETNLPVNFTHIYRTRNQWRAMPPKHPIPKFKYLPPKFVVVGHTASQSCSTPANCTIAIRNIQAGNMAGPFDDIAYNFLVAGDGLIYEGRGWMERSASTLGMGCSSLAVAFVGDFTNFIPPQQQIDAFALLLDTSVSIGKLVKNYIMFMQNEIIKTESPGKPLSDKLKKWPHWQPFGPEYLLCK